MKMGNYYVRVVGQFESSPADSKSQGKQKIELTVGDGVFGALRTYASRHGCYSSFLPNDKIVKIPKTLEDEGTVYIVCQTDQNLFNHLTETEEIILPCTIEKVCWSFWNCRRLQSIEVEGGGNRYLCSVDGVLFSGDKKMLKVYPNAHGASYLVPEGTVEIDSLAFKDCVGLQQLHLPSSLKKIGINAFYGCNTLRKITCDFFENDIEYEGITGEGQINAIWVDASGESFTPKKASLPVEPDGERTDHYVLADDSSDDSVDYISVH